MNSKQLKQLAALTPKTDAELLDILTRTIGAQTTREEAIALRDAKRADALKTIEDKYGLDAIIISADLEIDRNMHLVEMWAQAHRKTRFGDRKSIEIGGIALGWRSIGWRTATLAACTFKEASIFLKRMAAQGDAIAARFIREKVEIDKAAIIAARDDARAMEVAITAGICVETEDEFFIKRPGEGQSEATLKAA